jgi:hypothetical protein
LPQVKYKNSVTYEATKSVDVKDGLKTIFSEVFNDTYFD